MLVIFTNILQPSVEVKLVRDRDTDCEYQKYEIEKFMVIRRRRVAYMKKFYVTHANEFNQGNLCDSGPCQVLVTSNRRIEMDSITRNLAHIRFIVQCTSTHFCMSARGVLFTTELSA